MADKTTTPTATPIVITVNGQPVQALQSIGSRGEQKGKTVVVPAYKSGKAPDQGELLGLISTLGAGPLCKQFGKTIRSLFADASIEANVPHPTEKGKFTFDSGRFAAALLKEVAELDAGTKDVLLEELAKVDEEFNKLFADVTMNYIAKKAIVPDALANKITQLNVKRTELQGRLQKKSRTKKEDKETATVGAAS